VRITLIYPRFAEGYKSPARMEPLALGILAALTPKEHTLRVIDERVEPVPLDEPTDLIGISACTFSARRAYAIAAHYRARGVPVVLGGFHPTLQPGEAGAHADAVVVGDAEETWPHVLRDAVDRRLRPLYVSPSRPAAATTPDRSVFAGKGYLPVRLVQYGRGCPRSCDFCSIRAFYGGGVRHRPVGEVVEELRACRTRRVFFVDDNLMSSRHALRALLEAVAPLRLRWSSQMDISIADDADLLDLARRSGCQSLTIGIESLSACNLRQMGKSWNGASRLVERLARIRDAGIMVYGSFVFGYDDDDPSVFERTLAFALEQRLFIANFSPLQPLPGTPLYGRLRREGRLVYERWWMEPGYRWHEALLEPRGMSAQQLTDGCRVARNSFHSLAGIARRLPSRAHLAHPSNLALYLAANVVSRRDIRVKTWPRRVAS